MAFCTDDKHLSDIHREGTILHNISLAKNIGLPVEQAIQMATINAAQIFKLNRIGAIAPGYIADIVILKDLDSLELLQVYKDGKLTVDRGQVVRWPEDPHFPYSARVFDSVHLPPMSPKLLTLPHLSSYPVIEMIPGQIITKASSISSGNLKGAVDSGSIRKIAVIERHGGGGTTGVGLLAGYGLSHGAIATTVSHDSHNLIVVGDNDNDMLTAAKALEDCRGGYSIVQDGQLLGKLPLEIAGLMSSLPASEFIPELDKLLSIARSLDISDGLDPFISLSFMALTVLPEIRITDMGVFDTVKNTII